MPDTAALAEACALVQRAGLGDLAVGRAYPSTGGELVRIEAIEVHKRGPGVPLFDKPKDGATDVLRSEVLFDLIRRAQPIDPIEIKRTPAEGRYVLYDGFHRLHILAALGFEEIACKIYGEGFPFS